MLQYPTHPTCTWRHAQTILPTLHGRGGGAHCSVYPIPRDGGSLHGSCMVPLCASKTTTVQPSSQHLSCWARFVQRDQHKKRKEIGLNPICYHVISVVATWLDLTSPGFGLCMGAHLPSSPQNTSAKRCWSGATAWWHRLCLSRVQNTHPPLAMGEEKGNSA